MNLADTPRRLSVCIPVYNERATIESVLHALSGALPGVAMQWVIVDDCSTDGTREWLQTELAAPDAPLRRALCEAADAPLQIDVVFHTRNGGKGRALRTAFAHCVGDYVVIQDADLEYDPQDWRRMWPLLAERGVADAVYGSRFYGMPHRSLNFHHYLGNRLISWLFNLLFNQTLSDIEVCYKMFDRRLLDGRELVSEDFGIEVELSALIARSPGCRIYEVGISYYGRTYAEGKKIGWRDGIKALGFLFRYRFSARLRAPSR